MHEQHLLLSTVQVPSPDQLRLLVFPHTHRIITFGKICCKPNNKIFQKLQTVIIGNHNETYKILMFFAKDERINICIIECVILTILYKMSMYG